MKDRTIFLLTSASVVFVGMAGQRHRVFVRDGFVFYPISAAIIAGSTASRISYVCFSIPHGAVRVARLMSLDHAEYWIVSERLRFDPVDDFKSYVGEYIDDSLCPRPVKTLIDRRFPTLFRTLH